nr:cytochrome P450 867E38 [Ginkgo biloba]
MEINYSRVAVGLISVIVSVAIIVRLLNKKKYTKEGLSTAVPPGPPAVPIIGHLHLLKRPLCKRLAELSKEYGPLMHLRMGYRRTLVVSSSALAQECLTTNDIALASRPRLAAGKHLGYNFTVAAWSPYGHHWRNVRRICVLELLSARRIEMFMQFRREEVSALVRSLFLSSQRPGDAVNMRKNLSEMTFNMIVRMVANKRYFNIGSPDSSGESWQSVEGREFTEALKRTVLISSVFNIGDYIPVLGWLDLQGYERSMKKLQKQRDAFLQRLLDEHRQRRKTESSDTTDRDLIDVLLSIQEKGMHDDDYQFTDDIIKGIAVLMISAGTDTSATTIEWALSSLLKQPHILKRAQEELDTHVGRDRVVEESDLPKLEYVQAIVKETLRLYPPGPLLIAHEAMEPCTVGGYHIPVGTMVMVNVWAIHRDPSVWDKPLEFWPERFLLNREIDVKGQHFEFIPFGSGRRGCPGINLALRVVQFALATLLHSFDWKSVEDDIDMNEGIGVTMPKAVPLEAFPTPRLSLDLYNSS